MSRITEPGRFPWMSLALLGWMLAAWPAVASGQEEAPLPPLTVPLRVVPPSSASGASQELLERLGKMEERLDRVTKQNEDLWRENKVLAEKVGLFGTAPTGVTAAPPGDAGTGLFSPTDSGVSGPRGMGGQLDSAGGSDRGTAPTGGGS